MAKKEIQKSANPYRQGQPALVDVPKKKKEKENKEIIKSTETQKSSGSKKYVQITAGLAGIFLAGILLGGASVGFHSVRKTVAEASAKSSAKAEVSSETGMEKRKFSLKGLVQGLFKEEKDVVDMERGVVSASGNAETDNTAEDAAEEIAFAPHCTENTTPSKLINQTGICVNDVEVADQSTYRSMQEISFETGDSYTSAEGVISFRGNNFRDNPTYGLAEMTKNTITETWSADTGSLSYNGAYWSGSGWTGQPLIVKWPQETKAHMNMYDWAKADEELVEVIYACMDGNVYFLDLKTGKATRDVLSLGFTFKGAGALDPRGYPILYVGAGYDSNKGTAHVFVVSLIDGSVMYEFGANDPFSLRGALSYFDSSALVDAETDTLIYPGENGILYLIKLNTAYDQAAGTLSINPDPVVKWHYYGTRSSVGSYWVGMEDSAAIYKGYLFASDNGGNLMCINLNTLQLVWVQDVLDDTNTSPVLSIEDGHLYLYISTSFRLGWRSSYSAVVPIWKIDAETGEIIWQKDYECLSDEGVSGGVQSTIATGKNELSDYIYATVSKTGSSYGGGVLACLNKKTGEVEWEHESAYAWSSPVCVYNSDGTGKVIYGNSTGHMYLLDGKTGTELQMITLDQSNIEASPAVYENMLVVGTRGSRIMGIMLE